MQLQSFIVLLSLVSSPILSLSTTQNSGAGPHVGAVAGRMPVTIPALSSLNASTSIKSRHFGLARIIGQGQIQKRKSVADEAAGIQSAVYAIIVSISNGLSSANSLISGSTNVSFASQSPPANTTTTTDNSSDDTDDETCVADDPSSSTDSTDSTNSTSTSSSDASASTSVSASSIAVRIGGTSTANAPVPTGQVYSNSHATYYTQNGVAGHCGTVNPDSALIVALTTSMYGDGSKCGKYVIITRVSNGAQVTAKVADSCPTCLTTNSLDLSVAAFAAIATTEEGMVDITWQFSS